jgi:hypothetical protein
MKIPISRYLPPIVSTGVLLLLLVCLVPWVPGMPAGGLDPSWVQALNQAMSQRLSFGSDLVFTFGPYHAIYSRTYHPDTFTLMLTGSFLLTLVYWRMLALLWGSSPAAMATVGVLLASFARFTDPVLLFYPLLVALWGERLLRSGLPPSQRGWSWVWTVAPLGLLALIKGTILVVAIALVMLWGLHFLLQRQLLLSLTTLVVPLLTALISWLVAGQPLGAMAGYLQTTLELSSGFSESMSATGPNGQIAAYLVGAALVLVLLLLSSPSLALTSSVLLYLFVAFKQGYVRHDGHALIAGSALMMIATVAFWQQGPRMRYLLLAAAMIATAVGFQQIGPEISGHLANYTGTLRQFASRAFQQDLPQQYRQAQNRIAQNDPLPLLPGTTDIYAYNQSALIASGNRWHPRPVFQSYAAYAPGLAELNRQHLLGPDRPDYLFFRVETIDSRLPSLDDGASWPVILKNYQPVQWANPYLVLQATSTQPTEPVFQELYQRSHQLGQWVKLPEQSTEPVFMRLHIQPTLAGHLADLAFKTSKLVIQLELASGEVREFRISSGLARSGFVVSPFITHTADFALLLSGQSPKEKRVRAVSLHTSRLGSLLWQPSFGVSLQRIKFEPSPLPASFGRENVQTQ